MLVHRVSYKRTAGGDWEGMLVCETSLIKPTTSDWTIGVEIPLMGSSTLYCKCYLKSMPTYSVYASTRAVAMISR